MNFYYKKITKFIFILCKLDSQLSNFTGRSIQADAKNKSPESSFKVRITKKVVIVHA